MSKVTQISLGAVIENSLPRRLLDHELSGRLGPLQKAGLNLLREPVAVLAEGHGDAVMEQPSRIAVASLDPRGPRSRPGYEEDRS